MESQVRLRDVNIDVVEFQANNVVRLRENTGGAEIGKNPVPSAVSRTLIDTLSTDPPRSDQCRLSADPK